MRTAEEYVKEIHGFDLDSETTALIVRSYKSYAKHVAEQALQDAAEKAEIEYNARAGWGEDSYKVNRQSILNTQLQLP